MNCFKGFNCFIAIVLIAIVLIILNTIVFIAITLTLIDLIVIALIVSNILIVLIVLNVLFVIVITKFISIITILFNYQYEYQNSAIELPRTDVYIVPIHFAITTIGTIVILLVIHIV